MLVIAGVTLVAFVITLAVLGSREGGRARRRAAEQQKELAREQKPPALSDEELALAPDDFLLPSTQPLASEPHYEPFRTPLARWSPEMVEKFWVAPRDIAIEIISSANDARIRHLFESPP